MPHHSIETQNQLENNRAVENCEKRQLLPRLRTAALWAGAIATVGVVAWENGVNQTFNTVEGLSPDTVGVGKVNNALGDIDYTQKTVVLTGSGTAEAALRVDREVTIGDRDITIPGSSSEYQTRIGADVSIEAERGAIDVNAINEHGDGRLLALVDLDGIDLVAKNVDMQDYHHKDGVVKDFGEMVSSGDENNISVYVNNSAAEKFQDNCGKLLLHQSTFAPSITDYVKYRAFEAAQMVGEDDKQLSQDLLDRAQKPVDIVVKGELDDKYSQDNVDPRLFFDHNMLKRLDIKMRGNNCSESAELKNKIHMYKKGQDYSYRRK